MRRDLRRKKQKNDKIVIYSVAGILVLLAIVFALIMYGNSLDNEVRNSQLSSDQIASIVSNETDSKSASSNIGKSVEEQEENKEKQATNEVATQTNTTENTSSVNLTNSTTNGKNITNQENTGSTSRQVSTTTTNISSSEEQAKTNANVDKQENKKELSFQMPVEGEIVCEFAQDNLIFSDTLQEWVTHDGIDIKADKASVVKAAEDGTVKSIKNDPRYGLTIVIEHENGFQTVYSNLLSTEFVTEGEEVEKGQSIGTVGNTAAFESADEPHLHFEVIKDLVHVDPSIYVK